MLWCGLSWKLYESFPVRTQATSAYEDVWTYYFINIGSRFYSHTEALVHGREIFKMISKKTFVLFISETRTGVIRIAGLNNDRLWSCNSRPLTYSQQNSSRL